LSYAKQTWADTSAGGTPITAARLSHMEDGIADFQYVRVVTGSEGRPDGAGLVIWVGGSTSPSAMVIGDVWLSEAPVAPGTDVTAPSTPTGLASSDLTASSFTLTWNPSTDAVGVTGYEVQRDGVVVATPAGTTATIAGLTASTAYSMKVRARDAAGNWSPLSTALSVTTTAPAGDTSPPTVPTGLASSAITTTGFTLTWTASTDAVGVTGYEVQRDGVPVATPTGTSATLTGLSASTTYSMKVRARDAAGNWSALSSALLVTTGAPAAGTSVFGSAAFPYTLGKNSDGPVEVAQGFILVSPPVAKAVIGGRIYVPAGITVPTSATIHLHGPGTGNHANDSLSTPITTATMTGIASGQWNEVLFSAPVPISAGQYYWINYLFADGTYLAATSPGNVRIPASGATWLNIPDEVETGAGRSRFHYTVAGSFGDTNLLWGVDVLVADA